MNDFDLYDDSAGSSHLDTHDHHADITITDIDVDGGGTHVHRTEIDSDGSVTVTDIDVTARGTTTTITTTSTDVSLPGGGTLPDLEFTLDPGGPSGTSSPPAPDLSPSNSSASSPIVLPDMNNLPGLDVPDITPSDTSASSPIVLPDMNNLPGLDVPDSSAPITLPDSSAPIPDLTADPAPKPETSPAPKPDAKPDTPPAPTQQDTTPGSDDATPVVDPNAGVAPADGSHGDKDNYQGHWFYQEKDGLCAPSSIAQVVSEYTGVDISNPQQLEQRAIELGLFPNGDSSQGMTMPNMEILMEDQGVPCHVENSSIQDLKTKLAEGYGVVAAVDSGDIWNPATDTDNKMDHALVVSAVDETRGVVVLSDPGDPNGNMNEVPIAQFEKAWGASGHQMLIPDAPDKDLAEKPGGAPQKDPWAMMDLRSQ